MPESAFKHNFLPQKRVVDAFREHQEAAALRRSQSVVQQPAKVQQNALLQENARKQTCVF